MVDGGSDRLLAGSAGLAGVHLTALMTARMRAIHLLADGEPKIFVDDFAIALTGDDPMELLNLASNLPFSTAPWVLRSRVVEDRLAEATARGVHQYVILGAGLDSFAYRKAGLLGSLIVYEVDDPPLQEWKRARLAELGVEPPRQCVYVPCDFESRSLADTLAEARFRPNEPAFVSWLGVTQYLTRDAISETLRWVASLASGSEVVLTYVLPADASGDVPPAVRELRSRLRNSGAVLTSFLRPDEIEALMVEAGLVGVQHLSPEEASARYFSGRTDGLQPSLLERIVSGRARPERSAHES